MFDATYAIFLLVVILFMALPVGVLVRPGVVKLWRGLLIIFALPVLTAAYGASEARKRYSVYVPLSLPIYSLLLLLLGLNISIILLGFFDMGIFVVGVVGAIALYLLVIHALFYRRSSTV